MWSSEQSAYRAVVAPAEVSEPARLHNVPSPQHWAPIVVDQPAYPFESRPGPGAHRPDTVCDGWASAGFVVRAASVRGDAHRHRGVQRQDHAATALHKPTGTLLFAVLDGVSSAPYAHVGAENAGFHALRCVWEMLEGGKRIDWRVVLDTAAAALVDDPTYGLGKGESLSDVEGRLATPAVVGTVCPTRSGLLASMVRVGDSGAWLLRDETYTPLFAPKDAGGATIGSAVVPLPRVPERIEYAETGLDPGAVLLGATDGIGDPLGDGTGLVGQLFAHVLREPPPMLGFAHAVSFSRETFDDDRTLVAVWPVPGTR